jgi:hypothetical protein
MGELFPAIRIAVNPYFRIAVFPYCCIALLLYCCKYRLTSAHPFIALDQSIANHPHSTDSLSGLGLGPALLARGLRLGLSFWLIISAG